MTLPTGLRPVCRMTHREPTAWNLVHAASHCLKVRGYPDQARELRERCEPLLAENTEDQTEVLAIVTEYVEVE